MRKLQLPACTARDAIEICIKGIGLKDLKRRVDSDKDELLSCAAIYEDGARNGQLSGIVALSKTAGENPLVSKELKKKELVGLYENYFRKIGKPGRQLYDALMVAADEKCPMCGGIGRPRNLDHFLPKAFFPQFSVLPINLVPACRDCNMDGKGEAYAQRECEQLIHPYLDSELFFTDQWIACEVIASDPWVLRYHPSPPENWSDVDSLRAIKHFNDFDLAKRYSILAAEELSTVLSVRSGFLKDTTPEEFAEYLHSVGDAQLTVNHWKATMYKSLAENEEFCEA